MHFDKFSFGALEIDGNTYEQDVVIDRGEIRKRKKAPSCIWYGLRKRQESISEEAKEIAWKAQHRLHKRYMRLAAAGKDKRKITTAVLVNCWASSGP